jgi:predicted chitinase
MPDHQTRHQDSHLRGPTPRLRPDRGVGANDPTQGLGNQGRQDQLGVGAGAGAAGVVAYDTLMVEAAVTAALTAVPAALVTLAEEHLPVILSQCAATGVKNVNQVAYILATTEHESGFGQQDFSWSEPLIEDHNQYTQRQNGTWRSRNHVTDERVTGNTEEELDRRYWDNSYGGRLGNERGTSDAANYRGRGYVQLTGEDNYQRISDELRAEGFTYQLDGVTWGTRDNPIDLLTNFRHVNQSRELAAKILVDGMMEGDFTGLPLTDYVNDEGTDYKNARKVVNGDTAVNGTSIKGIAERYQRALAATWPLVFQPRRAPNA